MTHTEDNVICERQQVGIASPLAVPGRLAHREWGVNAVDRWIVEQLLDGHGAESKAAAE
jgi:hypothetical protein